MDHGAAELNALKGMREYYLHKGNLKEALHAQIQLFELRPRNLEYIETLADLYDWNGFALKKAKTLELKLPLISEKEREKLAFQLGQDYRYLKQFDDANRMFALLSPLQGQDRLSYIAQYYLSTKQEEPAFLVLQSLEKSGLILDELREQLVDIYVDKKQYREAIEQLLVLFGGSVEYKKLFGSADFIENQERVNERRIDLGKIIQYYGVLGKNDVLLEIFKKLSQLDPDEIEHYFEIAHFQIKTKDRDAAMVTAKKIEELLSKKRAAKENLVASEEYMQRLANLYGDLSLTEDSVKIYSQLLKQDQRRVSHYLNLARKYEELSNGKKSLDLYYQLLDKMNENGDTLIDDSRLKSPKPKKSIEKGKASPSSRSENEKREFSFLLAYEGDLSVLRLPATDMKSETIRDRKKRLRKSVLLKIASLHDQLDESEKAIRVYEELVDLDPTDPEIRKTLAQRYIWSEMPEKAVKMLAEALRLSPQEQLTRLKFAQLLAELKRPGDSNENLAIYLRQAPQTLQTLKLQAENFMALGELDRAFEAYQRVLDLDKQDAEALLFVAERDINQENYTSGVQRLEHLQELSPEHELPSYGLDLLEQGYFHQKSEKHELLCKKILEKYKNLTDPNAPNVDSGITSTYLRCVFRFQSRILATEMAKDYLKRYPQEHVVRRQLIQFLEEEKDYEQAIGQLDQLSQLKSEDLRAERDELLEDFWIKSTEKGFPFKFEATGLYTSTYSFEELTLGVGYRSRGFFELGVLLDQVYELNGGSKNFLQVMPHVSYWKDKNLEFSLGYKLISGAREYNRTPFRAEARLSEYQGFDGSFIFDQATPLYQTGPLMDSNIEMSLLELNGAYNRKNDWTVDLDLQRNAYIDGQSTFTGYKYSLSAFKLNFPVKNLWIGPDLSGSTTELINSYYTNIFNPRTFEYYIQGRYVFQSDQEKSNSWRFYPEMGVGGDLALGLSMGSLYRLGFYYVRSLEQRFNLKASTQFIKESRPGISDYSFNSDILLEYLF